MNRGLKLSVAALAATISVTALAAGTDNLAFGTADNPAFPNRLRVGIVAYCADLYHNAGDTGLQSNKANVQSGDVKQALANLSAGLAIVPGARPIPFDPARPPEWAFLPNLFQDGPFSNLGQYGAQNVADYLAYDDGIDRVRDLRVIDGSFYQPTAQQLANAFDIVIAYTDNKCGEPIPGAIATSAGTALAGFVNTTPPAGLPRKKLILTGFAFSSSLGFGPAIFGSGLSPLTKGGPGNAPLCARGAGVVGNPAGCAVGTCPAGCSNVPTDKGPECKDPAGNICTVYTPTSSVAGGAVVLGSPAPADQACREFLNNVNGPTSSSWATALGQANVARGATLCMNYQDSTVDGAATAIPFAAINAARNIVAVNSFPPDAHDIQKFWYGCILGDIVQYLSGQTQRCGGGAFCY